MVQDKVTLLFYCRFYMKVIESDAWKKLDRNLKVKVLEQIARKQLLTNLEYIIVETEKDQN
jgi:hypothetical protein